MKKLHRIRYIFFKKITYYNRFVYNSVHLVSLTIIVIIQGELFRRASDSHRNRLSSCKDFTSVARRIIRYSTRGEKDVLPRFLSNRLGRHPFPSNSFLSPQTRNLSSAKSRESDLNFLLNPRFSFDNGVRSRPRVYRDEMRFSPHSNKPLAPTGLYLLSLLPPFPANFRFYAPLRAFQLDAHSSIPSLRSLCKSGMKFFRFPLSCGFRVHRCPVYSAVWERPRLCMHIYAYTVRTIKERTYNNPLCLGKTSWTCFYLTFIKRLSFNAQIESRWFSALIIRNST